MRKNLGVKPYLLPMPVLIVGTYNMDGSANLMNAAYGSLRDYTSICLYLSKEHQTSANLLREKCFTVNLGNLDLLLSCDYVGCVSYKDDKNKIKKTDFKTINGSYVNAPIVKNLPFSLECELLSYDKEDGRTIGKIKNISVDSKYLDKNNKPQVNKMNLITYDAINNCYRLLGEDVGEAFVAGKILAEEEQKSELSEEERIKYLRKNLTRRVKRIKEMEKIMLELERKQEKLNLALKEMEDYKKQILAFDNYYSSPLWLEDYDANEYGLLPKDLSASVLNQDIPYDILGENYYLAKRLQQLVNKVLLHAYQK